jgi:hypothetical protein
MNCGVAVVLSLAVSSSTIFPMLNQREAFRRSIRASSCDIFPALSKPLFVNGGVGLTLKVGSEVEVGVEGSRVRETRLPMFCRAESASSRDQNISFYEAEEGIPATFHDFFWLTIFRAHI